MGTQLMKIPKLEAAGQQLEDAVALYFGTASPISVHTLTSAAYGILRDINEHRGGGVMVKDLHKYVAADRAQELRGRMNRAQNFFKHANNDPEGVLEFNPQETPLPLFEAILKYRELTDRLTPRLAAYVVWFLLQNRELLPNDQILRPMVDKVAAASVPATRDAFFNDAVEILAEMFRAEGSDGA